MTTVLRTNIVTRFSCLGDRCPDTCCRGWSMQVDEATLARYKSEAPELLVAVEPGQGETPWIMRKDPATTYCIKMEDGLCGIHKNYGERFLGDACHFYPRITRRLGDKVLMSAALSCPEIVRLALEESDPLAFVPAEVDRLPESLKDYLPEGVSSDDALAVHRAFLQAVQDSGMSAETIFLRIASVSRSIERIDKKGWRDAVPMYLKLADGRLPPSEPNIADPFNLLHALMGLIVASKKPMSERLLQTVSDMEKALDVTLDWDQVLILTGERSVEAWQERREMWKDKRAVQFEPLLRTFLTMQLSMALYPFAGFGTTLTERITVIGVRLATLKLALMCTEDDSQEAAIRITQSLARFLDHLGDPAFSLQIYSETGWIREGRMRGLLEA